MPIRLHDALFAMVIILCALLSHSEAATYAPSSTLSLELHPMRCTFEYGLSNATAAAAENGTRDGTLAHRSMHTLYFYTLRIVSSF